MKNKLISLLLAASVLLVFSSCKKDDNGDDQPVVPDNSYKYILQLSVPGASASVVHTLKSIEEGQTADLSQSQEVPTQAFGNLVQGKFGSVLMNFATRMERFVVDENGFLSKDGSFAPTGISSSNMVAFLDDEKVIYSGNGKANATGEFNYQIINIKNKVEESSGTITLPVTAPKQASLQSYYYKEGKIYAAYQHKATGQPADSATVGVFNAQTMEFEKLITHKTAHLLGLAVNSNGGLDESGNLYLGTCHSGYWGSVPNQPSGIVRINAGETDFDKNYFINISEKINGYHTSGMVYAGNNKAIVLAFKQELITKYADYGTLFAIEYHLVDLNNGQVQKLDIPLSREPKHSLIKLRDGRVAIISNNETENCIYLYNSTTNTLTKGLTYAGADKISGLVELQ